MFFENIILSISSQIRVKERPFPQLAMLHIKIEHGWIRNPKHLVLEADCAINHCPLKGYLFYFQFW